MKLSHRILTAALVAGPVALAAPALAATPVAAPVAAPAAATAVPVVVARYSFDGGAPGGRVAELSGRGTPLSVRSAQGGVVRFLPATSGGRYAALPAPCRTGATVCPRALLQGTDDPDLDPGTRRFRWGATVAITGSALAGSPNVVQKGVATTDSQWKLQLGAAAGRAQCVVVGQGSTRAYVARSSVGVADGRWHRLMCLRSGTTLAVFVDGRLRGQVAVPAGLSIANVLPLRVGGPNFTTTSDMYHGLLDDVYAALG